MSGEPSGGGAEVCLRNLSKAYGSTKAVDDVSVTIGKGEFFTILGPSGSGKTTTMMMVAGFEFPSAGEILIDGRSVADLPPQKRGLGMVFQNYAVFPHLSVFGNIAFPLEVRGMAAAQIKAEVGRMLEMVQMSALADRKPAQLSGGQQQRVALARALVFKPPVLLMDEPLGALDKKLRETMQSEIRRIHQHFHVSVIYVTHDQEEALTMSDRIAIMHNGRIEQVDSPSVMYEQPNSEFVANFLGETNLLQARVVEQRDGRVRIVTRSGVHLEGIAPTPVAAGQPVVCAIRPEKVVVLRDAGAVMPNNWVGTVDDVVYLGSSTRYRIAHGEDAVVVEVQNRDKLAQPGHGDRVALAWDTADMRLFAAAASA